MVCTVCVVRQIRGLSMRQTQITDLHTDKELIYYLCWPVAPQHTHTLLQAMSALAPGFKLPAAVSPLTLRDRGGRLSERDRKSAV